MRLAAESHLHLEKFLREHFANPSLRLPPLTVYCGKWAGLVTRLIGVAAITLGRFIIVTPRLTTRDAAGRRSLPGWLMAHEAVHVIQYRRAGAARFLIEYFGGYCRSLREGRSVNAAGRMRAYLSLAEECDARAAEVAYGVWLARTEDTEKGTPAGRNNRPAAT